MRSMMIAAVCVLTLTFAMMLVSAQGAEHRKESYPMIETRTLEYHDGETTCVGFMAWDANLSGPRPAVLIVHDWMGRAGFDEQRARELAALGYVGFSVDVFGKGVRPANVAEARETTRGWYGQPEALRQRLAAALEFVRGQDIVDSTRVAAIGYCFGGACVLELARSGADLSGVVSFHGGLRALGETGDVKASILVLHGADDPVVPDDQVAAFWAEMRESGADWQFVAFGDAVHSFTKPAAGDDKSAGSAYNRLADLRSWEMMKDFFTEVFARE